jgi:histone H3/H4
LSENDPKLFVKKTVRDFVNGLGCNVSSKVLDGSALNNQMKKLLTLAVERTKNQKRKTLMPKDFKGLISE